MTKGRRTLTEEEETLWREVIGKTKPLAKKKRVAAAPKKPTKTKASQALPAKQTDAMMFGSFEVAPTIETRTRAKLRTGKQPIDARLDLHGMTKESAFNALISFVQREYERGSRSLLVITGKGTRVNMSEAQYKRGILRDALPEWVASAPLSAMVHSFAPSAAAHGGEGAYYLLLRRRRA